MSHEHSDRLRFGAFQVDLHTRELWKHGIRLKLSGQPFEILAILLSSPGQLVTREQLRAQLWPSDTFVDFDHGLNAAINKLRDTLSDSVDSPRYIETLPRRGYRFIASVEPIIDSPPAASAFVGSAFRGGPLTDASRTTAELTATPGAALVSKGAGLESPSIEHATSFSQSSRWSLSSHPYFVASILAISLLLAATLLLQRVSFTANRRDSFFPVQRIRPLTNLPEETSDPAFSPSGDFLAFRRASDDPSRFGIFVQSLATDQLIQITGNADDSSPAWSPDGRFIAFTRSQNRAFSLHFAAFDPSNLAASVVRNLNTAGAAPIRPEIAWSPDGKSILFTTSAGLAVFSIANATVRLLTQSPPSCEDWGPAYSPDHQHLLFVRSHGTSNDEILSLALSGGEPTLIVSETANILGPPQWSFDSQSIIYASNRGSHAGLWRVPVTVREAPVQINDSGWYPSISPKGSRLAYQRLTRSLNVWELDVSSPMPNAQPRILIPATSETDQGPGPQISPDGNKVAYMSDHSGSMEIWVSDRDGSHPRQLTSHGSTGTPRWSPDSQSIVFDAGERNGPSIYSVRISGGPTRSLIPADFGESNNLCPSFSRDGKWVYFASTRSGHFEVWKVSADGGSPVQVTYHGGQAAQASRDGRFIYYAKSQYANPEIWQIPTDGGTEKLVSPVLNPVTWAAWSVTDRGIVFAHPSGQGRPVVGLYDPATRRLTNLSTLPIPPFWLTASPDASAILFDQPGWQQAQIMLVENFH
jgi:Tol biopolymer transport system component/DNA-binding winged helix-turn-helix (wHTH) protein